MWKLLLKSWSLAIGCSSLCLETIQV